MESAEPQVIGEALGYKVLDRHMVKDESGQYLIVYTLKSVAGTVDVDERLVTRGCSNEEWLKAGYNLLEAQALRQVYIDRLTRRA